MPTAADNLTSKSTDKEIARAISKCIGDELRRGAKHPTTREVLTQDQVTAMCFDMARKATGKQIRHGGGK